MFLTSHPVLLSNLCGSYYRYGIPMKFEETGTPNQPVHRSNLKGWAAPIFIPPNRSSVQFLV